MLVYDDVGKVACSVWAGARCVCPLVLLSLFSALQQLQRSTSRLPCGSFCLLASGLPGQLASQGSPHHGLPDGLQSSLADAAPAASKPEMDLKVTEGKGDSGLESDQDVIIVGEEVEGDDSDSKQGDGGGAKETGPVASKEEGTAVEISAEQLEAVLDEALRNASAAQQQQQELPGRNFLLTFVFADMSVLVFVALALCHGFVCKRSLHWCTLPSYH